MRLFQNVLLVIGAAALGAISCGPGLLYCMTATVLRPRPEDWGAAIVVIPLLGCGAALGAILGILASIRWMTTRDGANWKPRVWVGVAAGIAVGVTIRFSNALPGYATLGGLFQYWPVTAVLSAALGMLGGVVAKYLGAPWDRQDSTQRPKRKRQH